MEHDYALIMAGGGGTRLWPLSRKDRPKQMLPLVSEESLFRVSVMRLLPIFPLERIFVVTGHSQVAALQADVPELPPENFIVEPFGQESGPAAGLGVAHIACLDPQAVIAILTADHYIADVDGFHQALKTAHQVARDGYIVTLGITPDHPATGFGYIQRGDLLQSINGLAVYHSAGFKEKPDTETAKYFLESGQYSWNSGMFVWSAARALEEFGHQQPTICELLNTIQGAFSSEGYTKTIADVWPEMPKISLDYAVMERAERMAVIPVEIGWSDIGSWSAVYHQLADQPTDNVSMGGGKHLPIKTDGTLVNSRRLVVTIGTKNLVIIDTDDVLMICDLDNTQDVKLAVEQIRSNGLDSFL